MKELIGSDPENNQTLLASLCVCGPAAGHFLIIQPDTRRSEALKSGRSAPESQLLRS